MYTQLINGKRFVKHKMSNLKHMQQDAIEMLGHFIRLTIEKSDQHGRQFETMLTGTYKSEVQCLKCLSKSYQCEDFTTLALEVSEVVQTYDKPSLQRKNKLK